MSGGRYSAGNSYSAWPILENVKVIRIYGKLPTAPNVRNNKKYKKKYENYRETWELSFKRLVQSIHSYMKSTIYFYFVIILLIVWSIHFYSWINYKFQNPGHSPLQTPRCRNSSVIYIELSIFGKQILFRIALKFPSQTGIYFELPRVFK